MQFLTAPRTEPSGRITVFADIAGNKGGPARPRRLTAGRTGASSDRQAVHLLSVLDQQAGAALGQARVDGKTDEITQFPPLLEPLDLSQSVITAGCELAGAGDRVRVLLAELG